MAGQDDASMHQEQEDEEEVEQEEDQEEEELTPALKRQLAREMQGMCAVLANPATMEQKTLEEPSGRRREASRGQSFPSVPRDTRAANAATPPLRSQHENPKNFPLPHAQTALRAHATIYKYHAQPHSPIHHHKPPRHHPPKNLPKTARANRRNPSKKRHRTTAGAQDGAPEQHHDRRPQRHHLPPLGAHPGGRHLAARARRRHRVRALPRGARHRAGGLPHARLHRRPRRRLLPRHLPPLVLPRRHVRPHRRPPRLHHLRLRRHAQGHRRGRLRPRLQGVQARGLLQLAPEAGPERQELEQDQELPPGQQRLQVPRRQEGDMGAVHQERSLTHRVRLLQASQQLRLHLHQQHAVDRPPQVVGPRLHHLGQRRRRALLRLPVVQGRRGGHAEAELEAHRHHQHRLPRLHHHRLLHRLLRLQEQPQGPPQRRRVQAAGRVRLMGRLGYLITWTRS